MIGKKSFTNNQQWKQWRSDFDYVLPDVWPPGRHCWLYLCRCLCSIWSLQICPWSTGPRYHAHWCVSANQCVFVSIMCTQVYFFLLFFSYCKLALSNCLSPMIVLLKCICNTSRFFTEILKKYCCQNHRHWCFVILSRSKKALHKSCSKQKSANVSLHETI
mgnify:CR=1 FL=1